MPKRHKGPYGSPHKENDKLAGAGWDESLIQRLARERMPDHHFAQLFVMQAWTEWRLRWFRQVNFRRRENESARVAYGKMPVPDFEWINARQRWSNWRTIPRNLNYLLPERALFALDLCCGTGHSTEVVSCYLPPGSRVLGIEYNPEFVEAARRRAYLGRGGAPCRVAFRVQSVLDPFHDDRGELLEDRSVDLVNSCGAVGHHFGSEGVERLAREVRRVLRPGGLATIDVGLPGSRRSRFLRIFGSLDFEVVRTARSHVLDPYLQVCLRTPAP